MGARDHLNRLTGTRMAYIGELRQVVGGGVGAQRGGEYLRAVEDDHEIALGTVTTLGGIDGAEAGRDTRTATRVLKV
jgi:hypothetical protein